MRRGIVGCLSVFVRKMVGISDGCHVKFDVSVKMSNFSIRSDILYGILNYVMACHYDKLSSGRYFVVMKIFLLFRQLLYCQHEISTQQ